jgi:aerobic-type carbon monoxide dehydrogenase small subunit (CoxS/CutS family)
LGNFAQGLQPDTPLRPFRETHRNRGPRPSTAWGIIIANTVSASSSSRSAASSSSSSIRSVPRFALRSAQAWGCLHDRVGACCTGACSFRTITLSINGRHQTRRVSTRKNLADFVREDLGLTGTHVGCEHGVCGACSLLVDGILVRSCLMLAVQCRGCELTTIEGISAERLHAVQQAFWDHHALQCGFCTPGMVLTVVDLLNRKKNISEQDVRANLSGNLCRCTGYQFIVDATLAAARQVTRGESA